MYLVTWYSKYEGYVEKESIFAFKESAMQFARRVIEEGGSAELMDERGVCYEITF